MQTLLDGLLPRIFPNLQFACIPHSGKADLEGSIAKKLRAWRTPGDRFVIVRDNDNGDCLTRKQKLSQLCREGGRADTLVRIVCQEVEAWYLGDPEALAAAFADEKLRHIGNQARYRDPDAIPKPSDAIKQLVPGFQKIAGARNMANHLTRQRNRSTSFAAFLDGIERLGADASADPAAPTQANIESPDDR